MSKGSLAISLTLGIIFLAGCGQQPPLSTIEKPLDSVTQQTNQPIDSQTQAITTSTVDLASYSNSIYKYSFKYPKSVVLAEADKFNANVVQETDLKTVNGARVSVFVWKKEASPLLDPQTIAIGDFKKISIDGHEAVRGRDYGNGYFAETYADVGNYTFQIEYAGDDESDINTYNSIISNFKFTK